MSRRCQDCGTKPSAPRRRVCEGCRSRRDRERHVVRYTWENLCHHARARGIPVDLSLSSWAHFCRLSGYLERRGQGPDDLTVDRIEAGTRGQPGAYTETNIAFVTRSENAVKGNAEKAARQARWDRARRQLTGRAMR